jgi:hypothetical protein
LFRVKPSSFAGHSEASIPANRPESGKDIRFFFPSDCLIQRVSRFMVITDRFASCQAQWLNVHVDFPLLQRIALPITGGWPAKQIHQAVLTTFHLTDKAYGLNQLRYDLRKLKGHGLLERDGRRYAYRLTSKGVEVALLFLFFHKRLCGPLANSRFHHRPDPEHRPNSNLEAAYHKADRAIEEVVRLLAA